MKIFSDNAVKVSEEVVAFKADPSLDYGSSKFVEMNTNVLCVVLLELSQELHGFRCTEGLKVEHS